MGWDYAFDTCAKRVLSRAELMALGASGAALTAAVANNFLVRARRDHYVLPATERHIVEATRIGGRLGCVSALRDAGIFGLRPAGPHVHMHVPMSRSRSPKRRWIALTQHNREQARLHWNLLLEPDAGSEYSVGVVDALSQSARCQKPLMTLASIDNALHLEAIANSDVRTIFETAPASFRPWEGLVNGAAESGQETVLRMIVHRMGLPYEIQVPIAGVGRVDMVVAGQLVVEADSRLAHDGWGKHVEDRERDLALGALGYASLRPAYEHTMSRPGLVRDAILGILRRS